MSFAFQPFCLLAYLTNKILSDMMNWWQVMSNEEAMDSIRHRKDAQAAAKNLIEAAITRNSNDDISCIVVKF